VAADQPQFSSTQECGWQRILIALNALCVCNALTFESLDLKVRSRTQVHLQNLQFKLVYQGHRVKVKVTKAKCFGKWSAFDRMAEWQSC